MEAIAATSGEYVKMFIKKIEKQDSKSPRIGKDKNWEENLKAILHGKGGIGITEVNKILSPQFNDPSLRNMEMARQKDNRHDSR